MDGNGFESIGITLERGRPKQELIFEAFAALPTWMGFISHTLIIDLA